MEQQPLKDEFEHFDKMYQSLISAFDWILGKGYLKSEIIQKSIYEDFAKPENEDEAEEIVSTSRADTIGEIYTYASEHDLPTHLIDEAYEAAYEE